jgi:TonB family protein
VLQQIWKAVAIHLWQTTLVLLPLMLLAQLVRNGPAKLRNLLWTVGLAKLLLPLSLMEPVGRRFLLLVEQLCPALLAGHYGSMWVGRAGLVLDPSVLVVNGASAPRADIGFLFVILTVIWLAGAAWLTYGWMRRRARFGYRNVLLAHRIPPELGARLRLSLRQSGISGRVIQIVAGSALPAVTGLFRRRIVISERMIRELPAEELRAILLHEEEHRRRFDPLRVLVQRLALLVFFYYPPLWAMLQRLNSSCEIACDEAALRAGTLPATFARALARSLNLGLQPAPGSPGLGLEAKSVIQDRFQRLKHHGRYKAMKRHTIAIIIAVSLVGLVSLIPLPPFATGGDDKADVIESETPPAPAPPDGAAEGQVTMPVLIVETRVLPEYPEDARKGGISGKVMLEVLVREDGTAGSITVKNGIPGYPSFEDEAIKAVRQWRFKPATKDGKPVATTVTIPVMFRLDDK